MATAKKPARKAAKKPAPKHLPTPEQVRRQRERAGLTQGEAAGMLHTTLRAYQQWEAEAGTPSHRNMHPAFWELFTIKTADLQPRRAA